MKKCASVNIKPHTESFPYLGFGLGLRSVHYEDIFNGRARSEWFEALTENYLGLPGVGAGRPLGQLLKVRESRPIVLHGVSLSVGSSDPLDEDYLRRVADLIRKVEPAWVSDHLCWTGVGGVNSHDLLPMPYTEEALRHVVARIERVQEFWGRRILIENVSSYIEFTNNEMTEWEFLREVVRRADCALLLDVNNIYVSSRNQGFDPHSYLEAVPWRKVVQIHLAGHFDRGDAVIDTHDRPVRNEVWSLFSEALRHALWASVMVEWDSQIPPLSVVEDELMKARSIHDEIHKHKRDTSGASV